MSNAALFTIWISLVVANFLYALVGDGPLDVALSRAAEHSWFQALPVLCIAIAQWVNK